VTFSELDDWLPNGLHDGVLRQLGIDFEAAVLTLAVDLDTSAGSTRGSYRAADLSFSGVQFVVVDAPAQNERMRRSKIDAGQGQPETAPMQLPELRPECFLCWVFVEELNGFIRIAAESVEVSWHDQG
jgi:hypothetical protein